MNCGGKQAFRYKIRDNSQRKLARINCSSCDYRMRPLWKIIILHFYAGIWLSLHNHLPLQIPLFAFKNAATLQSC